MRGKGREREGVRVKDMLPHLEPLLTHGKEHSSARRHEMRGDDVDANFSPDVRPASLALSLSVFLLLLLSRRVPVLSIFSSFSLSPDEDEASERRIARARAEEERSKSSRDRHAN